MTQNKIVTSVSAIVDNVISPTENNVVCIDTRNSRIGVKKSLPLYEIDVNGTINIDGSLTNGANTLNSVFGISTKSITIGNTRISDTSSNFSGLVNFAQIICASGNFPNKCTISDCSITNLTCTSNFFVKSIKPNIGYTDISINGNLVFDSSVNKITTTNLHVKNITNISGSDISINGNVWIDGSLNIKGSATTPPTAITGVAIVTGSVTSSFLNIRSDDRLKQNEEAIINALLIIRKLNPQIYQKTANFMAIDYRGPLDQPYIVEAGLIAQEVEKIDELKFSVIRGNERTPYSINYNSIFIYCLAALKELDTNVENIKNVLNFNGQSNNGTSNPDLINIINNQNIQIQELINKISILENRISNIEKAF